MLLDFTQEFSFAGARFEELSQKNDWESAGKLAHTLKGVAGNLAARDLQDCAAKLEKAAKEKNKDEEE